MLEFRCSGKKRMRRTFSFDRVLSRRDLLRISLRRSALTILALAVFLWPISIRANVAPLPTVIFDGNATELTVASPFTESPDLWVTLADLTRATGYEVKPQGVCRKELCIPLPKQKSDYLAKRGSVTWFNLSAFARLTRQAASHDAQYSTWYFGVLHTNTGNKPETGNRLL